MMVSLFSNFIDYDSWYVGDEIAIKTLSKVFFILVGWRVRRQDNNTNQGETGVIRMKSIIWLQGTVGYLNTRVIQLLLHQNEDHT